MKLKILLLSTFAVMAGLFAGAKGIDPKNLAKKNEIMGGVFENDSKKPLNNVSVTAYLSSKKEKVTSTDVNGMFSFNDLKPGNYKFVFEKDGYKRTSREKVITRPDEGLQLNIMMDEHSTFDFMPGPSHFFGSE
jgi:hypothetical protein